MAKIAQKKENQKIYLNQLLILSPFLFLKNREASFQNPP